MGQSKQLSDSKVDAIATVVLILTVVAAAVYWVSHQ